MTITRLTPCQKAVLLELTTGLNTKDGWRFSLNGEFVTKHVNALLRFGFIEAVYEGDISKLFVTAAGRAAVAKMEARL